MHYMDFAIIILAAVMVWLLYTVTRETRAYGFKYRKHALRKARRPAVREAAIEPRRARG
jgi:hypothetical protein